MRVAKRLSSRLQSHSTTRDTHLSTYVSSQKKISFASRVFFSCKVLPFIQNLEQKNWYVLDLSRKVSSFCFVANSLLGSKSLNCFLKNYGILQNRTQLHKLSINAHFFKKVNRTIFVRKQFSKRKPAIVLLCLHVRLLNYVP